MSDVSDLGIICTKCAAQNGNGASFCSKCGTRLPSSLIEPEDVRAQPSTPENVTETPNPPMSVDAKSATVTCEIEQTGQATITNTSKGPYAVAECSSKK